MNNLNKMNNFILNQYIYNYEIRSIYFEQFYLEIKNELSDQTIRLVTLPASFIEKYIMDDIKIEKLYLCLIYQKNISNDIIIKSIKSKDNFSFELFYNCYNNDILISIMNIFNHNNNTHYYRSFDEIIKICKIRINYMNYNMSLSLRKIISNIIKY